MSRRVTMTPARRERRTRRALRESNSVLKARLLQNPAKAPVSRRVHAKGLVPIDKEQARYLARRAMDYFDKIRFRDDDEPLYYQRGVDLTWPKPIGDAAIRDVRGRNILVPIELRIVDPNRTHAAMTGRQAAREYVPGGDITFRHYGEDHPGIPYQIRIYLNRDLSPKQFRDARRQVEDEIYSVLIHELTHAGDVMPTPAQSDRQRSRATARREREDVLGWDERQYVNMPSEVRAFKQQVVQQVEDELQRLDEDGFSVPATAGSVEMLLEQSPVWMRIRDALEDENRRAIRRSAADAVARFERSSRRGNATRRRR